MSKTRNGSSAAPLRLAKFQDAPAWIQRPHILTGYLLGGTPLPAAAHTLFGWNNETLNAWTMILGIISALTGFAMAWANFPQRLEAPVLMVLSALPHLPASIRLHCTIGVSEQVRDFWRTMDVFFIFTCAVPRAAALGWHVFTARASFQAFMVVSLLVYMYCIYSTMFARRIKDIPKPILAKDVTVTVVCYTFPVATQAGRELLASRPGPACALYLAVVVLLVLGSSAYSKKWPERWAPGRFDLLGNSHQVMHLSVVVEYCVEWLFVFHMIGQLQHQESSLSSHKGDDQLGRLLSEIATPHQRY
ncbi:hypothetical protein WJX73_003656 [Symbiochloris irregularis]|uniref:Uncharacterized protein n=1 Tax=Symbiochloris irregularis TaxID=706552 RepID=A0AAW1P0X3_9CHLO